MVYMLLGNGFEEIEAIAPLDILRRAGIDVSTVSLTGDLPVRGGHDIAVEADITLDKVDFAPLEMLVLPGGGGGVASIKKTPAAMELIRRATEADKLLAAICAAPSLPAALNLVSGRQVACHPSVYDEVAAAGGILQPELPVVRDNNLITGKAAGASLDFGLELVAALRGKEAAEEIRKSLYYSIIP